MSDPMKIDRAPAPAEMSTPFSELLSERDASWRQALDMLPLGVGLLDTATGRTLWVNTALQRLLVEGIGISDVRDWQLSEYLPGLDKMTWEQQTQPLRMGESGTSSAPQRVQFVHQTTRNIAYWEWSVRPLEAAYPPRTLLLTVESVSDAVMSERLLITAGRTADRARRRTEALMRLTQQVNAPLTTTELLRVVTREVTAFFDASHAAVLLLRPEGDRFAIGYSLGLQETDSLVEPLLPRAQTLAGRALAQRKTLVVTDLTGQELQTYRLRDGSRPAAMVSSPIWYDDRAYGVIEIYFTQPRDIPDDARSLLDALADQTAIALHKAELYDQIAEQRRQLQSIFDNAPVGIIYFDTDGRVVTANADAARKYGRSIPQMVGQHHSAFLHDLPSSLFENTFDGAQFHASHSVCQTPGQDEMVCDISLLPVHDERERVVGALLLSFEVTELVRAQKEANAAREHAENLLAQIKTAHAQMVQLEKMRAIGELASGVAHDFNNALMAILGYAELAEDSLDTPETLAQHLAIIRKAALDASTTVQRLQSFARQRAVTNGELTDLNTIVQDVVELTRPRWKDAAQKEGRTYHVSTQTQPVSLVKGEPSGLREVLINFIHNALNAMPNGGSLTLKTRMYDAQIVEVEIADTGVGITPEVIGRIFEPFFTTRGVEGTGLGLAVSWTIIQRHHGTIDVESEPGKGTRFFLRLPVGEGEVAPAVSRAALTPVNPPQGRLLVVDDEPFVASVLTGILSRHGYRVTTVHSAEEALDRLRTEQEAYNLVLTDHGMPRMTGLQLVAEIKCSFPRVPVILLTGWGENLLQTHIAEELPNAVLGKPINQSDLLNAVSQVLRDRKIAH